MTREGALLRKIMLAVSKAGARIWRNNQGYATYPNGAVVKYGIANPGGSDLIGFVPLKITPEMVGRTVAVFCAAEVKVPGGYVTPEQFAFINAVNCAGGIAGVVRSEEEALRLLRSTEGGRGKEAG